MFTVSFLSHDSEQVKYFGPNGDTLIKAVLEYHPNLHFNYRLDDIVGKFYDESGYTVAIMRSEQSVNIPIFIN